MSSDFKFYYSADNWRQWRHLFDEARENDKSPVLLPNGSKLDELMLEENNPMDSDDDAGISDAM